MIFKFTHLHFESKAPGLIQLSNVHCAALYKHAHDLLYNLFACRNSGHNDNDCSTYYYAVHVAQT